MLKSNSTFAFRYSAPPFGNSVAASSRLRLHCWQASPLAGSVYAVAVGEQSSAFYFLHFRAWELLSGSLLALLPSVFRVPGAEAIRSTSPLLTHTKPAAEKQAYDAQSAPEMRQTFVAAFGLFMVLAT